MIRDLTKPDSRKRRLVELQNQHFCVDAVFLRVYATVNQGAPCRPGGFVETVLTVMPDAMAAELAT